MDKQDKIGILLIDDDNEVLEALGKVVELTGWKCFKAPTGEIGLDIFRINKIDAAVVDINLPKSDGFEIMKQMKQLKPNVPVIVLTGLGYEKEQVEKAVALGASGYVSKAMPVKDAITKIKAVLGRR